MRLTSNSFPTSSRHVRTTRLDVYTLGSPYVLDATPISSIYPMSELIAGGETTMKASPVVVKNVCIIMLTVLLVLIGQARNANGQTLTTIHSFTGGSDGGLPQAGLVQGSDGNFYGTTAGFANLGSGSFGGNSGTVFRISSSGIFTNLYSFTGGSDGGLPQAGLVQGSDGNFYGTTAGFANLGSGSFPGNSGTVFRISSSGIFTNLYSFTGGSDGASPHAGLVQGSDSNFYGTTQYGGNTNLNNGDGYGTVFRIGSTGGLTTLWSFTGGSDGGSPQAGLVQGSDGSFYGTTFGGGVYSSGTVFGITSLGILTNLYSFTGGSDGASPQAGLVQGSDGNFYGTTYSGGVSNNGTVFKLSANVSPFQINSILRVGSDIRISWQWPWSGYTRLERSSGDATGNYTNAWVPATAFMTVGPSTNYTDSAATTNHTRYYRVRMTPISP